MNKPISDWMTETYNKTARQYRLDDERHVTCEDHLRIKERLVSLCEAFGKPISVLDLGCGTGRHFHCFRNVKRLVGVDISTEMLSEAATPVCASEIQVRKVELLQGDIYSAAFDENTFDLIVCLGVFGNGCGLSEDVVRRMYRWLTPGGTLLLDVLDPRSLPPKIRLRRFLRWHLQRLLPERVQAVWQKLSGWPPCFYCNFSDLYDLTKRAGVRLVSLETISCHLPSGLGAKFLVSGRKHTVQTQMKPTSCQELVSTG